MRKSFSINELRTGAGSRPVTPSLSTTYVLLDSVRLLAKKNPAPRKVTGETC